MKYYLIVAVMLFSSSFSFGFGFPSKKKKELNQKQVDTKQTINKAPRWCDNPPTKKGYEYRCGTKTSQDYQVAIDKAELAAANSLMASLKSERETLKEMFETEIGDEFVDVFKQVFKQVSAEMTYAYRLKETKVTSEQTGAGRKKFRAYVLVEYDVGFQESKLVENIKKDEQLYAEFKAKEAFKDLEKAASEYRDRRNQ